MREIIITRKKSFVASLIKAVIVVDGKVVAVMKNGETVRLTIDDNSHEIFASLGNAAGNKLLINKGNQNISLSLKPAASTFKLYVENNAEDGQDHEMVVSAPDVQQEPATPKSKLPSYICGIVIAILCLTICGFVFKYGETSVWGFILGAIFSIASGLVIILGGFWFSIIPLPIIFIYKTGCTKPNQSTKRKVILGILSFVLPLLSVAALFIFRNL